MQLYFGLKDRLLGMPKCWKMHSLLFIQSMMDSTSEDFIFLDIFQLNEDDITTDV